MEAEGVGRESGGRSLPQKERKEALKAYTALSLDKILIHPFRCLISPLFLPILAPPLVSGLTSENIMFK
jgi:hypothetical protein